MRKPRSDISAAEARFIKQLLEIASQQLPVGTVQQAEKLLQKCDRLQQKQEQYESQDG